MSRLLAICVLFGCSIISFSQAGNWAQEPTSFLGIQIGKSIAASLPACPNMMIAGQSYPNPDARDTVNGGFLACYMSYPGASSSYDAVHMSSRIPFENLLINELDGGVASIYAAFSSDRSDEVAKALLEKYGKPTTDTIDHVLTKAGVPYDRRILVWVGQNVTVTFRSLGESTESGSVSASTKSYQLKLAADSDKSKDLYKKSF
jgi:hypothetical protein